MARDDNMPVTFLLPDGSVSLITWKYALNKLGEKLTPMANDLNLTTAALTRIDNQISKWLEEEE